MHDINLKVDFLFSVSFTCTFMIDVDIVSFPCYYFCALFMDQGGHGTGKTEFGCKLFQTGKTQGIWFIYFLTHGKLWQHWEIFEHLAACQVSYF